MLVLRWGLRFCLRVAEVFAARAWRVARRATSIRVILLILSLCLVRMRLRWGWCCCVWCDWLGMWRLRCRVIGGIRSGRRNGWARRGRFWVAILRR